MFIGFPAISCPPLLGYQIGIKWLYGLIRPLSGQFHNVKYSVFYSPPPRSPRTRITLPPLWLLAHARTMPYCTATSRTILVHCLNAMLHRTITMLALWLLPMQESCHVAPHHHAPLWCFRIVRCNFIM